jgi:hypothetical protein
MILIKLFALVVIISMLTVSLSVPVSVTLGYREIASEHQDSQRADEHPFCRFHSPLQSEGVAVRVA